MEERQKEIFAQRLSELRKEKNETQAEFSQRTGIRQQTISGYENGKISPTLDAAIEIAKACDVSVDWLCGLTDTRRNKFIEYADVIMALVDIGQATGGNLYLTKVEVDRYDYDDRWIEEQIALRIEDEKIQKFLKSWNDILPLVKSKTISGNLYSLWLKDEMRKYKIKTPAAKEQEEWENILSDDDLPFIVDDGTDQAKDTIPQESSYPTEDAEKKDGEEK